MSIEKEKERNFVKNIIKKLQVIKYLLGLKKDNGKWKWLSNQTTVDATQGKSPWAPGENLVGHINRTGSLIAQPFVVNI